MVDGEDRRKPVELYDTSYGEFGTAAQEAVRRGAFGEDIGQNSWLTADEWRRDLARLELTADSALLEIACGSGGPAIVAARETGCRVVGVDRHPQGIATGTRLAAQHGVAGRVTFLAHDASRPLPFDDGAFDAVTCIDAIHHFPDRAAVLVEWRRVLRPGGRVLYTDPILVTGMLTNDEIALRSSIGFFQFTPPGVNEQLLAAAGFEVLAVEDATENMATVARRWRDARAEHRDALRAFETAETFEGQQRFLAVTSALAAERRLSRFTFLARRV